MRRQARISIGGALVVRTASALQVWLWLLIFVFQNEFRISRSIQPGYLDFDNLPETNFTCTGKVIGGYYADLETSCQMFHVCTVGQQEEPMDIKFLCLNGTVFDQETRVCERVDEVDCTKSEKFYSLNLELYGSSTAPPISTPDQLKPQAEPTEQNNKKTKPSHEIDVPTFDENTTKQDKEHPIDTIDSTEDPIQDIKKDTKKFLQETVLPTHPPFPTGNEEFNEEYQEEDEIDSENNEYEEDYSHYPTTTSIPTITTTTNHPTTTTTVPSPSTTLRISSPISHLISTQLPTISSLPFQAPISSSVPSPPSNPTSDPSLLSPQEFIYRHRGPGSEAISFQRQSFRPADGVYITHAPPQQFDHFQYESSRTAPRPAAPHPAPFVQRPQPTPFRPTTLDPRDQQLRPGPTSQPSERYETSIKHRPQPYPSAQPVQRPVQYNPYYYDRKRSEDSLPQNESSLTARSVAPPVNERTLNKPKSPPRVIVTASASVSDSNGKRLNYTVGNVVSAVKPIVPINYDDYKESDLIFDPFFLDVPKLQKRRKTRSNQNRQIFTVPATTALADKSTTSSKITTLSPVSSKRTTIERSPTSSSTPITTTTAAWNPDDYVDDNYEAHAFIPPMPPLAVLMIQDSIKSKKQERSKQELLFNKTHKIAHREKSVKPTSAAQISSSQSAATSSVSPPRRLPAVAYPPLTVGHVPKI